MLAGPAPEDAVQLAGPSIANIAHPIFALFADQPARIALNNGLLASTASETTNREVHHLINKRKGNLTMLVVSSIIAGDPLGSSAYAKQNGH